jgi:hypothetical protein
LIESKFRLRGITSEEVKFDVIVGSLPRASLRQVLDVMEHPNATTPYTTLKTRLMSAHELTKFQRIEALLKVEPLGARKPSELLAQMLELCPRGEERSPFFIFLFLQRLSKELRVLLGDEALEEPHDIGKLADKKWALHSHQHIGTIAVVELTEEEGQVAAVKQTAAGSRARGKRGGWGKDCGSGGWGRGCGSSGQQNTESVMPSQAPAALARMSTGIGEHR